MGAFEEWKQKKDYDRSASEEFAKKGIQWKVADAKAAGINPLVALGASPAQYSSTFVADPPRPDSRGGMGGQNLGMQNYRNASAEERADEIHRLTVTHMGHQNTIIGNQAALSNMRLKSMVGPPVYNENGQLIGGQTSTSQGMSGQLQAGGWVAPKTQFMSSKMTHSKRRGVDAGVKNLYAEFIRPDGTKVLLPGQDAQMALISSGGQGTEEYLRRSVKRAAHRIRELYRYGKGKYKRTRARNQKKWRKRIRRLGWD